MKPRVILAACALLASSAGHAAVSPATQAEVDHLLNKVGQSSCRFNRNGSWHEAKEARAHLQKKLDYLVKRDMLKNAETFIEHAATKSSMSGEPYKIQCPGSPPVPSGTWFSEELKRYRKGN